MLLHQKAYWINNQKLTLMLQDVGEISEFKISKLSCGVWHQNVNSRSVDLTDAGLY